MDRWTVVVAGLSVMLVISAMAVIYTKYQSRLVFIEIQKLERALDHYEVQWGQLQLELMTLAEHNRIELIARNKLKLQMPKRENIIYIKP